MTFVETGVQGAYLVEVEPHADERGFFARTFCTREFGERGLVTEFVQCSISQNNRKGTLRGMHYQVAPGQEAKLVRCTRGAIWDVIVDLRPESPTRGRQVAVELSGANRRALYVPPLCAHGFQTLEDDTEVFYQISAFHAPELARGMRYDDPQLGIRWPLPVSVISERDRSWALVG